MATTNDGPSAETGSVARVFPERGYGFIRMPDGDEVFFERGVVERLLFATLTQGAAVALEIDRRRGLQATRVVPA